MIERKHHVVEHDIMAAVWRAAEMIPGLDDARGTGRPARWAHRFLPIPCTAQDRRAGRIDLAASEPPSGLVLRAIVAGRPPRDGEPKSGSTRSAFDQRHAFNRLAGELADKAARCIHRRLFA